MKNCDVLHKVNEAEYHSETSGLTLKRGLPGEKAPNGNSVQGLWCLRDINGLMVRYGQYRYDIAEEFNLRLMAKIQNIA